MLPGGTEAPAPRPYFLLAPLIYGIGIVWRGGVLRTCPSYLVPPGWMIMTSFSDHWTSGAPILEVELFVGPDGAE